MSNQIPSDPIINPFPVNPTQQKMEETPLPKEKISSSKDSIETSSRDSQGAAPVIDSSTPQMELPLENISAADFAFYIRKIFKSIRNQNIADEAVQAEKAAEWLQANINDFEYLQAVRRMIVKYAREMRELIEAYNTEVDTINPILEKYNQQQGPSFDMVESLKRAQAAYDISEKKPEDLKKLQEAVKTYNQSIQPQNTEIDQYNQFLHAFNEKIKTFNEKLKALNELGASIGEPSIDSFQTLDLIQKHSAVTIPVTFPAPFQVRVGAVKYPNPPSEEFLLKKHYEPLLKQTLIAFQTTQAIWEKLISAAELSQFYRQPGQSGELIIEERTLLRKQLAQEVEEQREEVAKTTDLLNIQERSLHRLLNRKLREITLSNLEKKPIDLTEKLDILLLTLLSQNSLSASSTAFSVLESKLEKIDKDNPALEILFSLDFAKNLTDVICLKNLDDYLLAFLEKELEFKGDGLLPFSKELVAEFKLSLLLISLSMISRALSLPGLSTQLILLLPKPETFQRALIIDSSLKDQLKLPLEPRERENLVKILTNVFAKQKIPLAEAKKKAEDFLNGTSERPQVVLENHPLWSVAPEQRMTIAELASAIKGEIISRLAPTIDRKEAEATADEILNLLGVVEMREREKPSSLMNLMRLQIEALSAEKSEAKSEALAEQFRAHMKPNVELYDFLIKLMNPANALLLSAKTGIIYSDPSAKTPTRPMQV
jgi:hypothetical protein